ncbi:TetR family transcriptional regulator [Promicromonospora thailandica]|uniref:Transcriptional regulator, TetR family n=1 Tax=Promicromonospora thailandica TaxID=765201 RepID=A0A9X2GD91_9MICO|nr:TetR/AcrR family transcriptional regulator [Promicromonospora thailandica]MCP2267086.1 transcriptional regulator, TetR family [Promicromonospora thailandica]BFF16632.1 TetR/AcrR family transcriptional regulator [Promicromonospora thailandica]
MSPAASTTPTAPADTDAVLPGAGRPLRADAARNREAVLTAAEEEFAEHGLEASISAIARRAGVAKGTVFRHFATKEELATAIAARHAQELTSLARRLRGAADAEAALLEFLTEAAGRLQRRRVAVLMTVPAPGSELAHLQREVHDEVVLLVDEARAAGVVRPDVTGTDVFLLMCAPVHAVDYLADPPPELWRRYVGVILDGLRPDGASPLPHPAPTWP